MTKAGLMELVACFSDMPDPRVFGRADHYLLNILVLTICAVLWGVENWEAVEMWGEALASS